MECADKAIDCCACRSAACILASDILGGDLSGSTGTVAPPNPSARAAAKAKIRMRMCPSRQA
ncbi:hypothetical protein D3C72_2183960 [compost metagenome]